MHQRPNNLKTPNANQVFRKWKSIRHIVNTVNKGIRQHSCQIQIQISSTIITQELINKQNYKHKSQIRIIYQVDAARSRVWICRNVHTSCREGCWETMAHATAYATVTTSAVKDHVLHMSIITHWNRKNPLTQQKTWIWTRGKSGTDRTEF